MATAAVASTREKKRSLGKWKGCYDYKTDYNDHFETPLIAYEDISPLLDYLLASKLKITHDSDSKRTTKQEQALLNRMRNSHVLYDPYYCDGKTSVLLLQLGFHRVVHAKRDFYKDVTNDAIPSHDTLITNPPYSGDHKERCLQICLENFQKHQRPFFLLMPNYVASRSYYQRILGTSAEDVGYLLPSISYEYEHPEGTGHEIPPFSSLWFCGVGKDRVKELKEYWDQRVWEHEHQRQRPRFVSSLSELAELGAIPTQKRPNPRQRKKLRKAVAEKPAAKTTADREESTSGHIEPAGAKGQVQKSTPSNSESLRNSSKKSKKKSRYRDDTGSRTKTRF
jgi:hypothetical protein